MQTFFACANRGVEASRWSSLLAAAGDAWRSLPAERSTVFRVVRLEKFTLPVVGEIGKSQKLEHTQHSFLIVQADFWILGVFLKKIRF